MVEKTTIDHICHTVSTWPWCSCCHNFLVFGNHKCFRGCTSIQSSVVHCKPPSLIWFAHRLQGSIMDRQHLCESTFIYKIIISASMLPHSVSFCAQAFMDFLPKHHQLWSGTLRAAQLCTAEMTEGLPSKCCKFFFAKSTGGQFSFRNGTLKIPPSGLFLTALCITPFNYPSCKGTFSQAGTCWWAPP